MGWLGALVYRSARRRERDRRARRRHRLLALHCQPLSRGARGRAWLSRGAPALARDRGAAEAWLLAHGPHERVVDLLMASARSHLRAIEFGHVEDVGDPSPLGVDLGEHDR